MRHPKEASNDSLAEARRAPTLAHTTQHISAAPSICYATSHRLHLSDGAVLMHERMSNICTVPIIVPNRIQELRITISCVYVCGDKVRTATFFSALAISKSPQTEFTERQIILKVH